MHLVNWDTLTKSKVCGGLGIQKSDARNRAILSGLTWWLIQQPTKLWTQILTNKHMGHPYTVSSCRIVSRTWKNIQRG